MARPSKVDPCMFCGQAPCICNEKTPAPKKTVKSRAKPKAKTKAEALPEPVEVPRHEKPSVTALQDAMRSSATITSETTHLRPRTEEELILEDVEMCRAIQVVEPLMHPHEKRRFERVLLRTVSIVERRSAWREKIRGS